jgi:hypothetical protein
MSPEKETAKKAFLGQDEVRCKIIVDNKCSQQIENFKCLHYEISYENDKDAQQKPSFFFKYWVLQTTINQLGSSNLQGRKYTSIIYWLSQLFSIEAKFDCQTKG